MGPLVQGLVDQGTVFGLKEAIQSLGSESSVGLISGVLHL